MLPEKMRYAENDIACYYYDSGEAAYACVEQLCDLAAYSPLLLEPFKGDDDKARTAVARDFLNHKVSCQDIELPFSCDRKPVLYVKGFYLLPTVYKTSLFYHSDSDFFFKILHSLTLKNKLISLVTDRARYLYDITCRLIAAGVRVPKIHAYGMLRKGRKTFYVMERIKGESLFTILVKKREALSEKTYFRVMDAVAALHKLGYWFGDMRIAHVFVDDADIPCFVDIDGIKKNVPFRLKNIAKDLAGLNQPELQLTEDEKKAFFDYYISRSNVKNKTHLLFLIKRYSKRRWRT